jgi:hypothetical protein
MQTRQWQLLEYFVQHLDTRLHQSQLHVRPVQQGDTLMRQLLQNLSPVKRFAMPAHQ